MIVSGSSQSDMGDVKLQNWSNGSIKPSSFPLPSGSWVDGSFLPAIMISITLFIDGSAGIVFSLLAVQFLLETVPLSYFSQKHLMVSISTNISLPVLIGFDAWNERIPIGNISLLLLLLWHFLCSCFLCGFVVLLCWPGTCSCCSLCNCIVSGVLCTCSSGLSSSKF